MGNSSLSERLSAVRKRTGLSQANFGKKLGISDRTYKNYENEITDISSTVLKKIANEFDVDIRWLLLGRGFIDSQTLGDVVESVVLDTRTFLTKKGVQLNPEREAKIVRYLVGQVEEYDYLSEETKRSFFNAIFVKT